MDKSFSIVKKDKNLYFKAGRLQFVCDRDGRLHLLTLCCREKLDPEGRSAVCSICRAPSIYFGTYFFLDHPYRDVDCWLLYWEKESLALEQAGALREALSYLEDYRQFFETFASYCLSRKLRYDLVEYCTLLVEICEYYSHKESIGSSQVKKFLEHKKNEDREEYHRAKDYLDGDQWI